MKDGLVDISQPGQRFLQENVRKYVKTSLYYLKAAKLSPSSQVSSKIRRTPSKINYCLLLITNHSLKEERLKICDSKSGEPFLYHVPNSRYHSLKFS